jgi:predicted ribosomally synthesized peptide with SipW-like signal peptide
VDRRIVTGAIAALAAVALGVGGTTSAAFNDYADVPGNEASAGTLLLELDQTGSDTAALRFGDLMPGSHTSRAIWLARNSKESSVAGTVSIGFSHLVDTPAPCDTSRDKARAELAAGVPGCTVTATTASGMPERGNLSRLLTFAVAARPADGRDACTANGDAVLARLPAAGQGNLPALASAAGTVAIVDGAGHPLVLLPGHGACLVVSADWPVDPHAAVPDNAAQGDSLTVTVRVQLTQVHS